MVDSPAQVVFVIHSKLIRQVKVSDASVADTLHLVEVRSEQ